MASERETRTEKDIWGNDHEYIYEDGKRVGEYKTEDRGGFLGFGDERQKVEYDADRNEVGYTRRERRGGFLGFGEEEVEAGYDKDGTRAGYSRVEERGGFLGLGSHHARIGYDEDGNEVSSTQWQRRGGILGIGERHARVTTYSDRDGRTRSDRSSSSSTGDSGWEEALGKTVIGLVAIVAIVWFVFTVIIPLAIINAAVLALIAAAVTSKKRSTLFIVSACGALYTLLDYNAGGLTRNLGEAIPALRDWISAFVYVGVCAGLVSGYFLLQPVLARGVPADEEHLRRQQLILLGCLAALGCGILGTQRYVDVRWLRAHPSTATAPLMRDQRNDASVGAPPYRTGVSERAPARPPSPRVHAAGETQTTPVAGRAPEPPGGSLASATPRHVGARRQKEPRTAVPAAPPTIDCVLPDGQETRLNAERCEAAGGMEYR